MRPKLGILGFWIEIRYVPEAEIDWSRNHPVAVFEGAGTRHRVEIEFSADEVAGVLSLRD